MQALRAERPAGKWVSHCPRMDRGDCSSTYKATSTTSRTTGRPTGRTAGRVSGSGALYHLLITCYGS